MRILLVELPVHIPTVMPYSVTMMKSVLKSSLDEEIIVLDLNAEYHHKKYKEFYEKSKKEDYFEILGEFVKKTRRDYSKISKTAVKGNLPEGHDELIKHILSKKPEVVCISLTYNSQLFFASGIIDKLNENNILVIVGGPADKTKIKQKVMVLENYDLLIKKLVKMGAKQKEKMETSYLNFSDYDKDKYLTKKIVYPVRTAHSCPYKLCAFCTHHGNAKYETISLDFIKESIEKNNMKKVFFIDDSFTKKRLLEIIGLMKDYKIEFWMQLRPEKYIIELLPELYDAGLKGAAWGIESGCQRILDFMQKGTKIKEIKDVLKKSHELGIKNTVYIMFGFPTETKEEFMETLMFLEDNKEYVDLVSPTIFGLQKGSRAFLHPDKFGIKNISYEKRTLLGEKINYETSSGLTPSEVKSLKRKHIKQINHLNKVPKVINAAKEQILNV